MTRLARLLAVAVALVGVIAVLAAIARPAEAAKRKKSSPAAAAAGRSQKTVAPARSSARVPPPGPRIAPATRRPYSVADTASGSTGAPTQGQTASGSDAARPEGGGSEPAGDGQGGPTTTKAAKTKVYTFGAMDVEGKLKTPQLLYFLNRVKLELDMSAPDHRSFMKELEKTAEDPNL